jgi:hypothetical protein
MSRVKGTERTLITLFDACSSQVFSMMMMIINENFIDFPMPSLAGFFHQPAVVGNKYVSAAEQCVMASDSIKVSWRKFEVSPAWVN